MACIRCCVTKHTFILDMSQETPYHRLLGISATADDREIDAAYRRLSLSYHPDNIPWVDSDEVRQAKTILFRALCDANRFLQNPVRKNRPQSTLWEAYLAWASAVMNAFTCSSQGDAVKLLAALGVPALMIAMGGAERGGRLCMTLALTLTGDSHADLGSMSEEDMRIFRAAVMVLAQNADE